MPTTETRPSLLMRLRSTSDDEAWLEFELYVGDVGLPNYVIIDPSDESKHGRYAEGACVTTADAENFTES